MGSYSWNSEFKETVFVAKIDLMSSKELVTVLTDIAKYTSDKRAT